MTKKLSVCLFSACLTVAHLTPAIASEVVVRGAPRLKHGLTSQLLRLADPVQGQSNLVQLAQLAAENQFGQSSREARVLMRLVSNHKAYEEIQALQQYPTQAVSQHTMQRLKQITGRELVQSFGEEEFEQFLQDNLASITLVAQVLRMDARSRELLELIASGDIAKLTGGAQLEALYQGLHREEGQLRGTKESAPVLVGGAVLLSPGHTLGLRPAVLELRQGLVHPAKSPPTSVVLGPQTQARSRTWSFLRALLQPLLRLFGPSAKEVLGLNTEEASVFSRGTLRDMRRAMKILGQESLAAKLCEVLQDTRYAHEVEILQESKVEAHQEHAAERLVQAAVPGKSSRWRKRYQPYIKKALIRTLQAGTPPGGITAQDFMESLRNQVRTTAREVLAERSRDPTDTAANREWRPEYLGELNRVRDPLPHFSIEATAAHFAWDKKWYWWYLRLFRGVPKRMLSRYIVDLGSIANVGNSRAIKKLYSMLQEKYRDANVLVDWFEDEHKANAILVTYQDIVVGGYPFWLSIRPDPDAIELNYPMLSLDDPNANRVSEKIQQDFFDSAQRIGVRPRKGPGAGHINFSRATFGQDSLLFRNFLVDLANNNETLWWRAVFGDRPHSSPKLGQMHPRGREAFLQVIKEFDFDFQQGKIWTIESLMYRIQAMVYLLDDRINSQSTKEQAVSFYHASELEPEYRRRIELRDVNAPTDTHQVRLRSELLQGRLRYLAGLDTLLEYHPPSGREGLRQNVASFHQYVVESGRPWDEYYSQMSLFMRAADRLDRLTDLLR